MPAGSTSETRDGFDGWLAASLMICLSYLDESSQSFDRRQGRIGREGVHVPVVDHQHHGIGVVEIEASDRNGTYLRPPLDRAARR